MNNWQKDIKEKFNKITKEAVNADQSVRQDRSNLSGSSNSSRIGKTAPSNDFDTGSGSSSVLRGRVSEKAGQLTKVERRTNLMITREAALDDLEQLEKEATDASSKIMVKVAKIIVKVLATIRSNQLLTDEDKARIKTARAEKKPEVK
jgi:hypothetical protein